MPRRSPASWVCALALALLALTACDAGARVGAGPPRPSTMPTHASVSASASASASRPAAGSEPAAGAAASSPVPGRSTVAGDPTAAAAVTAPSFTASARGVTAADLGASWHAGCPVGPAQLREISLTFWGFDSIAHTGRIVVNVDAVPAVEAAFKTLYLQRFPIRSMRPLSEFGGSDDASMAVDNTSGFNCRDAVAPGAPHWSAHAYGKAIDVNTVENPYLEGGKVLPPQGSPFKERAPYRAGMAAPGGQLVRAFAAVGWQWGGRWSGSPDFQHFSSTGG